MAFGIRADMHLPFVCKICGKFISISKYSVSLSIIFRVLQCQNK